MVYAMHNDSDQLSLTDPNRMGNSRLKTAADPGTEKQRCSICRKQDDEQNTKPTICNKKFS